MFPYGFGSVSLVSSYIFYDDDEDDDDDACGSCGAACVRRVRRLRRVRAARAKRACVLRRALRCWCRMLVRVKRRARICGRCGDAGTRWTYSSLRTLFAEFAVTTKSSESCCTTPAGLGQ